MYINSIFKHDRNWNTPTPHRKIVNLVWVTFYSCQKCKKDLFQTCLDKMNPPAETRSELDAKLTFVRSKLFLPVRDRCGKKNPLVDNSINHGVICKQNSVSAIQKSLVEKYIPEKFSGTQIDYVTSFISHLCLFTFRPSEKDI